MNFYLSKHVGTGTRCNPFRARGSEHGVIDLRPDRSVRDGYALVASEDTLRDALKLSEDHRDPMSLRTRRRLMNRLGVDLAKARRFDLAVATLMMQPNGWNPLRPVLSQWRYEIWLGGLLWTFPLLSGGASDDFNRANETPLASPWAFVTQGDQIYLTSNHVAPATTASARYGYYPGAAATSDQYAQSRLVTAATDNAGPAVRCQSGAYGNAYIYSSANNAAYSIVLGSLTSIMSTAFSLADNDILRMEMAGSTLRMYRNGTQSSASPITDTAIPSGGQPGFWLYDGTLDDWAGGDLGLSSGPRYPGTNATLSNAGTLESAEPWVTPANAGADDGTVTQITAATYDSPDISELLVCSNFGFTLPTDAQVKGILVEIDRNSAAGSASENRVQLAKGTTFASLVGSNKADFVTSWPAALATVSYGGPDDLWGTTWTAAEINSASFAVMLSVQADSANTDIAVDFIRVTVSYEPAAAAGWVTTL